MQAGDNPIAAILTRADNDGLQLPAFYKAICNRLHIVIAMRAQPLQRRGDVRQRNIDAGFHSLDDELVGFLVSLLFLRRLSLQLFFGGFVLWWWIASTW